MAWTLAYRYLNLIESDTARTLLTQIASLYAPFVTTIFAFYYGSHPKSDQLVGVGIQSLATPYWMAMAISMLWNVSVLAVLFVDCGAVIFRLQLPDRFAVSLLLRAHFFGESLECSARGCDLAFFRRARRLSPALAIDTHSVNGSGDRNGEEDNETRGDDSAHAHSALLTAG